MPNRSLTPVYLLTVLTAACSILYELVLAQTLSELGGNTVIWYSLTIGLFIGAMGLGAFLAKRVAAKRPLWEALFRVELLLAAIGALAPTVMHLAHMLSSYSLVAEDYATSFLVFAGSAVLLISLVGLLSGIELPLLIQIGNLGQKQPVTNRILAADYFGCLLGAVLFPLALVRSAENTTLGFAVGFTNALIALSLVAKIEHCKSFRRVNSFAVCAFLFGAIVIRDDITQYFLRKYYYYQYFAESLPQMFSLGNETPRIERHRSAYQKIDLVEDFTGDNSSIVMDAYSTKFAKNPSFPRDKMLFLNGERQVYSNFEELYHEYLAHVPIIASGTVPQRVLILGGGDGILAKELLKYQQVSSITLVDIDPTVVELSRTHPILRVMNEGALDNPRVKVIIGDGFEFARTSRETFDAIFSDFPHPADYNTARLYSRELYHFISKRLSENGFLAFDADGIESLSYPDFFGRQEVSADNLWDYYYESVHAAGFERVVPYFCNLEPDNHRAMELVAKSGIIKLEPGAPPESFTMLLRDFVQVHSFSLQSGFVFARKRSQPEQPWKENGVDLHVLNSDRYRRAFQSPLRVPRISNPELVNSVMRPTLPQTPFIMIKLPYYGGG